VRWERKDEIRLDEFFPASSVSYEQADDQTDQDYDPFVFSARAVGRDLVSLGERKKTVEGITEFSPGPWGEEAKTSK
jgi:hypothetical protein